MSNDIELMDIDENYSIELKNMNKIKYEIKKDLLRSFNQFPDQKLDYSKLFHSKIYTSHIKQVLIKYTQPKTLKKKSIRCEVRTRACLTHQSLSLTPWKIF